MTNKQTAVEWLVTQLQKHYFIGDIKNAPVYLEAKEMEREHKGYSKEDVTEMLFMALNELKEECCATHTKDSIVRKVLNTFKSEQNETKQS